MLSTKFEVKATYVTFSLHMTHMVSICMWYVGIPCSPHSPFSSSRLLPHGMHLDSQLSPLMFHLMALSCIQISVENSFLAFIFVWCKALKYQMMFSYNIQNYSDQTFEFQSTRDEILIFKILGDIYFIHFDIVSLLAMTLTFIILT